MKQITEDYVSYETAQLLKEKGFDNGCNGLYYENKKFDISLGMYSNSELEKHDIKGMISAPTHQMTLKWLREVHGFIVTIYYDRYEVENGENSIVGYGYNIQTKDNPEDYYRISESVYDCYEEATKAALLYALKNLI